MMGKSSMNQNNENRHTQWDGLFVSQHALDSDDVSDPQPMLSADEKQAIWDMLLVANERNRLVFIQFWQDRYFHYQRCTIRKLDWEQQRIICEEALGSQPISIGAIISIHMLD